MRLLLLTDTYVPVRISGALQMRDLAVEMVRQGHRPLVVTPTPDLLLPWQVELLDGVEILRIRTPRTKDVGLLRRALAECFLPWSFWRGLHSSPYAQERWDGVVWYSPTIFLGPLAAWTKRRHVCRSYLILRDLFPDWAVDAGVMKRGLPYRFFKQVERFQYRVADVIGVQTPANVPLVARDAPIGARIEVLHNWLAAPSMPTDRIEPVSLGRLEGRTLFVYAGNMGVAQDMDAFVDLARRMHDSNDIGFLFVGRGSESARLKAEVSTQGPDNLLILDEVEPTALPALLAQCSVGIVALHPKHGTHNIPGKFLTYLHAGLPVLARLNPDNDLHALMANEGVGCSVDGDSMAMLHASALRLAEDVAGRQRMGEAGRLLATRMFSPEAAVRQIIGALN